MADTPNENNDAQVPPKLNLKPDGGSSDEDAALQDGATMHIKMPGDGDLAASAGPKRLQIRPETVQTVKVSPTATPPSAETAPPVDPKKQTSKIPLEEANNAPSEGKGRQTQAPKTIKIRPVTKQFKAPEGVEGTSALTATSNTASLDEKRKTSRISLDSVYKADTLKKSTDELGEAVQADAEPAEEVQDPSRPKTIRLKRPSEAATIKMTKPSADLDTAETATAIGKSAPAGADESSELNPTRRKTIRVKRPSESRGVSPQATAMTVKRSEGVTPAAPSASPSPTFSLQPVTDQLGAGYLLGAIAALLAICVTVYMLLSAMTGPNVCWTQTSIGGTSPLPWPGKFIPSQTN